ncbi:hypothetical protein LINPERPRIM_LOCUS10980 [Linum perenne]
MYAQTPTEPTDSGTYNVGIKCATITPDEDRRCFHGFQESGSGGDGGRTFRRR